MNGIDIRNSFSSIFSARLLKAQRIASVLYGVSVVLFEIPFHPNFICLGIIFFPGNEFAHGIQTAGRFHGFADCSSVFIFYGIFVPIFFDIRVFHNQQRRRRVRIDVVHRLLCLQAENARKQSNHSTNFFFIHSHLQARGCRRAVIFSSDQGRKRPRHLSHIYRTRFPAGILRK